MRREWRPTPAQLECRDLSHQWTPFDAWKDASRGFVRVLRCERCRSRKTQKLDRQGYVLTTSISYPQGYLRKEGGRLTQDERADLRLSNINHLPEPAGEDDD